MALQELFLWYCLGGNKDIKLTLEQKWSDILNVLTWKTRRSPWKQPKQQWIENDQQEPGSTGHMHSGTERVGKTSK